MELRIVATFFLAVVIQFNWAFAAETKAAAEPCRLSPWLRGHMRYPTSAYPGGSRQDLLDGTDSPETNR